MADPTSAFDLSALPAWARRLRLRDLDEDASCERTPVCFTFDEAAALVDGLCATAQYQPHQDVRSYLVDLFCTLPHAGGEALDVVEARQDAIVEALERDTANAASRLAADHAGVLICVASERARHPGWGAWVDIPALLALQRRLGTGDRTDADKEYGRLLDRVLTAGLLRTKPDPMPHKALLGLEERFPNFAGPIRFLAEQQALATLARRPMHVPPILLTGPAGVGKTSFAAALAKLHGAHCEVLNMASQSCGFTLSGLDRGWSQARPGIVFEALMHGKTMAPVIVLDELDKANTDGRSQPLGPLYTLLERRTAAAFRDEYASFPIDASHVTWLATSNDVDALPGPLLSRFKVFEIALPSDAQLQTIAAAIWREMTTDLGDAPAALPAGWAARLAGCSARDLHNCMQEALGRAALRTVTAGLSQLQVDERDLVVAGARRTTVMGFR